MRIAKRSFLILVVLFACVGCDQTTKSIAKSVLPETEALSFLGDSVRLRLVYNPGGFLSFGASLPEPLRKGIFTIGVGFLLLGSLAYALYANTRFPSEVLAAALVFSGGVGNLLDRLLYNGSVVDFISLGFGSIRTGIFNLTDLSIILGVVLLLVTSFQRSRRQVR
jgi:signal peptidase II